MKQLYKTIAQTVAGIGLLGVVAYVYANPLLSAPRYQFGFYELLFGLLAGLALYVAYKNGKQLDRIPV